MAALMGLLDPQVIKLFLCSTQLSMKCQLLIKSNMLKTVFVFKLSDGVLIMLIMLKFQ